MSTGLERTALTFEVGTAWPVLVLGLLAVGALVVLGVRSVTSMTRGRAAVLVTLRVALAALVVLLALRPVLRREQISVTSAPVAIVVDSSGSMVVRDQPGGLTRIDAVSEWVARHEEELRELEGRAVVDWFEAADGGVRAVTRAEIASAPPEPAGGTDLAAVFDALSERYAGRGRPAVVLLSDAADRAELRSVARSGAPLADALGEGGPIVSLLPAAGGFSDLAIDLVAHDPVGFLRTEWTVRARVRSTGLPAAEVPVTLLRGDDVLQVRSVRVGGEAGPSADVTFTLEPVQVGESLFRVQVPMRAGEAVADNNESVFSVRVVRDRIRALQIVGRPSWDGRFLRELLKRDPAIDLISFFILRSTWDDPLAHVEELSLIPFPVDELFGEKLDGFDLVIFQNFNFRPYGIQQYLGAVARHVRERGGGLAVIGGDLAFGEGYRTTELQDVLPVAVGSRVDWTGASVEVRATDVGERHPILRLGGGRTGSEEAIEQLLPVAGLNLGLAPKAEAQVLLEAEGGGATSAGRSLAGRPVVVTGEHGEGRALVMLTDGTWRWSLPMAGRGRSPRSYERFWENSIRWLIRDPRSALLVLESDRRTVSPGESAEVRVLVRNQRYEPVEGMPVEIRVRDAAGEVVSEQDVDTGNDGIARLRFEPRRPGLFAVTAVAAGEEAGPLYLQRVDESRELADAAIDEQLAEALAAATDGAVHRLEDGFPRLPFGEDREVRVESASVTPLWRSWPAWALIAGLFSLEWWLRRRWGLA